MSSVFTDDIIYEIFKLLKDTDVYGNSLYSCLYVNRRFCVIAAPFLWKTTFQKEAKSNIFISTYISCLNKRFHGWQNDNDRSLLLSGRFLTMSPLFEYETYLKEFSFKSLNKAVNHWFDCEYGSEDPKKKTITSKLEFYLFKMFAEKSALESLAIELDVENCWKIKEVFLGGSSRVSSIKNLSISFPTLTLKEPRFLSKVRRFLRELKIVFQNLDEVCFFVDEASDSNDLISQSSVEIISFVQNQKNLKGFNLIGGEDKFLPAKDIITSSLKAHANSLIHLNVDNVHFSGMSFSFFEKCCKLELLGMGYCKGLHNMDPNAKFSNLKKLELSLNQFQPHITASILKKAGESLVELDIDDVSHEISEVLVTYCTKIETLSISGKTKLALPWLSKLRNLKRLEFMQVAEMCNFNESEMSVLPSNIKIKKIITELFMTEFDCFYKSTQHLDFSLVSIIFSPEVKDFESISYEDPESSLEINIGSSGGTNPTEEYKHITIKKKRSDVLLNFHYLSEKLLAKEN
ncbi:unnamed protein product [Rhizophagus irregularis]|uniref:F-box domain-containing protein n=3 Tax=Rhizophagus irregularis TaxID=588596 RepID=A0A916EAJ8_9GLOM|nr:unnamed protein product [Rhizophagus irregularis]CAB5199092.1 unnamed protein product [Rhizophagus irregularis]CAB5372320.1 unnamed protein product [Rhizophagus irregularis]